MATRDTTTIPAKLEDVGLSLEVNLGDIVEDLPNPTLQDASKFKEELERDVEEALTKFGEQTGLTVDFLEVEYLRGQCRWSCFRPPMPKVLRAGATVYTRPLVLMSQPLRRCGVAGSAGQSLRYHNFPHYQESILVT